MWFVFFTNNIDKFLQFHKGLFVKTTYTQNSISVPKSYSAVKARLKPPASR